VPELRADLTTRELEVLNLMSRGFTNSQIAMELIISRATVKYHVSNILSKMSVSSRTEAVAKAVQIKLISGLDGE
jgi:NarL family two-component system response regulator LiaR